MPASRTIEIIETVSPPRALIIGKSTLTELLSSTLSEYGCDVQTLAEYEPSIPSYDYIFLFAGEDAIGKLSERHLSTDGKMAVIETDTPISYAVDSPRVIFIRLGALQAWEPEAAIQAILRTVFTPGPSFLVDLRKTKSVDSLSSKKPESPNLRPVTQKPLPSYTQKPHIPKSFVEIKKPLKVVQRKPEESEMIVEHKTGLKHVLRLIVLLIISLLVVCGIAGFWYVSKLRSSIRQFQTHVAESNWEAVSSDLTEIRGLVYTGRQVYNSIYTVVVPIRGIKAVRDTGTLLTATNGLLQASDDTIRLFMDAKKEAFQTGLTENTIDQMTDQINGFQHSIVQSMDIIDQSSVPFIPKLQFQSFFTSLSGRLDGFLAILPLWKKVWLTATPKTYMVLFQNSMELRPTGGFIGSYGILKIAGGRMEDFKIYDVYTADGQLKGHVDPPLAIRKYLSQPNWFLRDSNFDPDFSISGDKASWFLNKEMNVDVDGVIGINIFVAENLLKVLGSVSLPDFNQETISADNFFFKAHYYAQNQFFPGSTQKRDFLTSIAQSLERRMSDDKNIPWVDLMTVVQKQLDEKNILLFFRDPEVQKVVDSKGWSGRMHPVNCIQVSLDSGIDQSCYPDYLSVNEANLGVNKANYFVSKTVTVEKVLADDGLLNTTATFSFDNNTIPEVFGSTEYKSYVRIFIPTGSLVKSVSFNKIPVAMTDLDIEPYSGDKISVGYLMKIAANNKGVISIAYTLSRRLDTAFNTYQFYYQKQPGEKSSSFMFSIKHPDSLTITPLNFANSSGIRREIFYTSDTSVDRILALQIQK